METQANLDEGIDLKRTFEVIHKRKRLVFGVFLFFFLGSLFFNLLKPKLFQAKAMILVSQPEAQSTNKLLLTSNEVLQRLSQRLASMGYQKASIGREDLLQKLSILEEPSSNILQLQSADESPALATELVNLWADEYMSYISEIISGEVEEKSNSFLHHFLVAKKDYLDSEQKLVEFRNQNQLDLMEKDFIIKKNMFNQHKESLMKFRAELVAQEAILNELKNQIARQEPFIITSKAISNEVLWQQAVREKRNNEDLSKLNLKTEEVNPLYQNLKIQTADTERTLSVYHAKIDYLKELMPSMEKDIKALNKLLNEKRLEFDQLRHEVTRNREIYENLSEKVEDARTTNARQLGQVMLISPAYQPQRPASSNTSQNIIWFGFIGLILGLFAAFIVESF